MRFLYQPLSVNASLLRFSKSFTFGALNVACQIPANRPTPNTGLSTKNGAVKPLNQQVKKEAPPIRVKRNVQLAFDITQ